jgi:hypothetical protein
MAGSAILGGGMAIRQIGKRGLLFTQSELVCWQIYRLYQRRQLRSDLMAWGDVFWPRFLRHLSWPEAYALKLIQLLIILAVWPMLLIGALLQMLAKWLWFPARFLATFFTPKTLHAPGEKSLLGLHNAFVSASVSSVSLSDALYIDCIDEWVEQLYGPEVAAKRSLSVYLRQLEDERRGLTLEVNLEASLRDELAVARERLSRDLGHYLIDECKVA